jgi:hypothetical protein
MKLGRGQGKKVIVFGVVMFLLIAGIALFASLAQITNTNTSDVWIIDKINSNGFRASGVSPNTGYFENTYSINSVSKSDYLSLATNAVIGATYSGSNGEHYTSSSGYYIIKTGSPSSSILFIRIGKTEIPIAFSYTQTAYTGSIYNSECTLKGRSDDTYGVTITAKSDKATLQEATLFDLDVVSGSGNGKTIVNNKVILTSNISNIAIGSCTHLTNPYDSIAKIDDLSTIKEYNSNSFSTDYRRKILADKVIAAGGTPIYTANNERYLLVKDSKFKSSVLLVGKIFYDAEGRFAITASDNPTKISFGIVFSDKATKNICGNGLCESGETYTSCIEDCGSQEISRLNLTLQSQLDIINQLNGTISQKLEYIKQLNNNLADQEAIVNKLNLNVQEKQLAIVALNKEISVQSSAINNMTQNLEEKGALISKLTAENKEQAELIKQMKLSFADQGEVLSGLDNEIEDDAQIIDILADSTAEEGEILSGYKGTLQEDAALIVNLTADVNEQAEIVKNMKLTIEEEQQLVAMLAALTGTEAEIYNQALLVDNSSSKINYLDYSIIGCFVVLISAFAYMGYRAYTKK